MKWPSIKTAIGLSIASAVLTCAACVALAVWAGGAL